VYHSRPIDHTNVRGVAKRRVHVIRRGRYGTGTYKKRGRGRESEPGATSNEVRAHSRRGGDASCPDGGQQGSKSGSEGWDVGCSCTNMMSGERMGAPEPAWEGGIGVRGCPALRGTRGRSAAPPSSFWGPRGGGRWRQRRANPTRPRARATSLWYGYMPKKCPGGRTRAAGGLRRQCGGEEGVGVVAWWIQDWGG